MILGRHPSIHSSDQRGALPLAALTWPPRASHSKPSKGLFSRRGFRYVRADASVLWYREMLGSFVERLSRPNHPNDRPILA